MHAGIVRKLLLMAGLVGALLLAFGLRAAARLPVPYLTQWEMRYDCSTPPVLTYNGDRNCGPASMAMAVQADGKRESGLTDIAWVHTMRKRMTGYDDNGGCETVTSLPQMQTACSYYGLPCSRVQGEYALKRTVNLGFPFIAYVDSTRLLPRQYPEWMAGWHFIVVTGVCDVDGEALVYVNDPFSQSLGPGSYTFASFWDAFQAGGSDGLAVGPSFGTLFPDVLEYSGSGRKSWIAVRNGSPTAGTNVDVTYYSSSGSYYGTQCATLGGRESRAFAPSFSFLIGTSASSADKSVSTVVTTTEAFDSEAYAYSGVPSTPSVSGVGAGTDVFVPCNFYNYYGWSSEIYVQNANSAATTACALFYPDSGGTPIRTCNGINFGARQTFAFTNAMIGSVRVTATLPVGVVVRHKHGSIDDMAYNGLVSGGTAAYLPSLFRNYYNTWYSSYQVQETTGNSVHVHVYYYPPSTPPYKEFDLAARGHKEVYLGNEPLPNGWRGSARVVVIGGNGQVATAIHHASSVIGMGYQGFKAGARDLTMPILIRNTDWQASLTVQNVGTVSTNVTVRFYNLSGTQVGGPVEIPSLAAWYSQELYSQIPNPFEGSVQVSGASADIVAAVHETHTAGRGYGYSVP